MSLSYVGQIIQGGWNFAPRNFALCNGALLPIAQQSALFSLLGTTFGGNGTVTFGLPDLRGRVAVGTGQMPGGSDYELGQMAGTENTTLLTSNMPAHTHTATVNMTSSLSAASVKATVQAPAAGSVLARSVDTSTNGTALPAIYSPSGTTADIQLGGLNVAGTVTNSIAGQSLPFNNLQPYLAITTVICISGVFPSRN